MHTSPFINLLHTSKLPPELYLLFLKKCDLATIPCIGKVLADRLYTHVPLSPVAIVKPSYIKGIGYTRNKAINNFVLNKTQKLHISDTEAAKILNKMDEDSLRKIPTIGNTMSKKIYVQLPIYSIFDLNSVGGIGNKRFNGIKQYLNLNSAKHE